MLACLYSKIGSFILKKRKKDNDEMLIKCVEDDWNNSKLNKIVKSDE